MTPNRKWTDQHISNTLHRPRDIATRVMYPLRRASLQVLDGLLRLTDVIAKSEKPGGIVVKDVTLLGLRKEVRIDDSSSASSSSRMRR